MGTTTILLVDDHHVVREGLRVLLEAEPDLSVVGEAADGLEVAKLVERLQPNVMVVDLMMPGLNGLEVTRHVRQHFTETRVVILSMYANEAYVLQALRNGADGYVLKDATATELVRAVREAAAGRRYLSPPLSERAIEAYVHKAQTATPDVYETLTTREREVLQLAAEGHRNPQIAARLMISPRTAETHRTNLMRKLGLNTQTDLVRYAVRQGLLPADAPLEEQREKRAKPQKKK
jgi:DNA-binding NarL/FixJ family response regulator